MRFCSSIASTSALEAVADLERLAEIGAARRPRLARGDEAAAAGEADEHAEALDLVHGDLDDVARLRGRRRGGAGRLLPAGAATGSGLGASAFTERPIRSPFFGSSSMRSTWTCTASPAVSRSCGFDTRSQDELGDVDEPLDAPDVHERAVVLHARHDALEDRAGRELLARRARLRGPLLLEERAAGKDAVARVGALHLEQELLADERGRIAHEPHVDLRHRAEGADAVDLHLEAALVRRP